MDRSSHPAMQRNRREVPMCGPRPDHGQVRATQNSFIKHNTLHFGTYRTREKFLLRGPRLETKRRAKSQAYLHQNQDFYKYADHCYGSIPGPYNRSFAFCPARAKARGFVHRIHIFHIPLNNCYVFLSVQTICRDCSVLQSCRLKHKHLT